MKMQHLFSNTHFLGTLVVLLALTLKDPTCCTGNVKYFSFRKNQNFWMEYSTPSTTPYPEYKEDSSSTLRPPGPHFLTTNHSRLQSPVGATTILDCQVDNLKNLQVSWFRKGDGMLYFLTVGKDTFVADPRFSLALKKPGPEDGNWCLRIHPTQAGDDGTYLCQISTHPPTLLITHLQVIVPKVFLVDEDSYTLQEGGGREKHYNSGSSIDIHCVVNNYLPYFKAVIWTHNGHTITQDSGHGGISIKTNIYNTTADSHLYFSMASAADSGTYSCNVADLASAHLSLHILNGEEPAAAIQSSSISSPSFGRYCFLVLLSAFFGLMSFFG